MNLFMNLLDSSSKWYEIVSGYYLILFHICIKEQVIA
jgi:hypothetical protein